MACPRVESAPRPLRVEEHHKVLTLETCTCHPLSTSLRDCEGHLWVAGLLSRVKGEAHAFREEARLAVGGR